MSSLKYKRILLKLSGEALAGSDKQGINPDVLNRISDEIKEVVQLGVEVGIVVGAGNIFRGTMSDSLGIDRVTGDYMGMLATVINSLAVKDALLKKNVDARVMTSIEMKEVAEPYIIDKARHHLGKGRVVLVAAGTGHPFFTTDTASGLRGIELDVDILLKATRVDGVYTGDPEKDKNAEKIDSISYLDVIKKNLKVMDLTAISLCMENNLPVIVFNLFNKDSLMKIIKSENTGTIIS